MLGLITTVLFTNITGVQHLFDIASLHSSPFALSSPIQNSDKCDLRTARINLVQDDTEIIDRHKN